MWHHLWPILAFILLVGNLLPYILLFLGFVAAVCEVIDRASR